MNGRLADQAFVMGTIYADFRARARDEWRLGAKLFWADAALELFGVARALTCADSEGDQVVALDALDALAERVREFSGDQRLVEVHDRLTLVAA